ncbi:MAG: glycosyltransferase family 39 protein [Chloroflexi bacterium]|nr:glycosyltransferase family 39 protein [Chloroflexota bacterium]
MRKHAPFLAILAGYFLVAGLFAIRVPAWQAPDEPAHYNVVRQIAENGCCPVIQSGDWDSAFLDQLKQQKFAPALLGQITAVEYEDHQPPLYYLLLAPVYSLSGGSLTALRLASVVIGAGVVLAAYAVALRAFRGKYGVAYAAAAFVAFLPQHVHILASVNNDALALALTGAILWASIDYADGGRTPAWALGLLVGAALLTKSTAYLMGGVAFISILIRPLVPNPSGAVVGTPYMATARRLAAFLVPASILGALWWLRNFTVYGFPDFLGLRAHDLVVVGQLRTADYIADVGLAQYASNALQTTVTSFYGQFGWMALPLPVWALGALLAVTVVGLASAAFNPARKLAARGTWRVFGLTAFLSVAMLVYYNTSFVQFQGRYVYPLLIPLAVTVALGLDILRHRLPFVRALPWLNAAALSLVAVLDVWLLWRVIVPNLTP